MKKQLLTLACSVLLSVALADTAFAGTWQPDGNLWWYQETDGTYPAAAWKPIDGAWYHFNEAGYMETGWITEDGDWYYLEPSGAMRTAPLTENGLTYYFNGSGVCVNPDGAADSGVLTETQLAELQYSLELTYWINELSAMTAKMESWTPALEAGRFDEVKAEILSSKETYNGVFSITPPERFAAAHSELTAAIQDYNASMDLFYRLVDGAQNQTLTDEAAEQLTAEYYAYQESSQAHAQRFNELAAAA